MHDAEGAAADKHAIADATAVHDVSPGVSAESIQAAHPHAADAQSDDTSMVHSSQQLPSRGIGSVKQAEASTAPMKSSDTIHVQHWVGSDRLPEHRDSDSQACMRLMQSPILI